MKSTASNNPSIGQCIIIIIAITMFRMNSQSSVPDWFRIAHNIHLVFAYVFVKLISFERILKMIFYYAENIAIKLNNEKYK